jgi:hypothetical protein
MCNVLYFSPQLLPPEVPTTFRFFSKNELDGLEVILSFQNLFSFSETDN